jgi:hypothetical protein
MEPTILSRTEFDDGSYIDVLEPADGGEMYYRSCFKGICRYSSDLWQAECYAHQMTSAAEWEIRQAKLRDSSQSDQGISP